MRLKHHVSIHNSEKWLTKEILMKNSLL